MSFGDQFSVCPGAGGCVGVGYGGREGEILVSFKSGAVHVFNVNDLGKVCSWQLPTSEQLLSAAVADETSYAYWVLTTPGGLLRWSRDDVMIKVNSTCTLRPDPVQLLSSPASIHPIVVYGNGEVGLEGGTTVPVAPKGVKKWRLCMADVSEQGAVCVVGRTNVITVGVVWISGGELGQPVTTSLKCKGTDLVSSCLSGDKILLLCTEGQVWVLPMQCPLQPVLLTSTLPALPNTQLVPLSRDYFILADTQSLQLWDNKFYTCQHSISTAGCQGSKVWCVEGSVYSCAEGELSGWHVERLHRATLAAALGKSSQKYQTKILTSWPQSQKELLQSAESATLSCLPALVNRSETPDLQTFMSVFHSCSLSSDIDYVDVIERVLIEKDFWACEVLSELLQASLVPSNVDVLPVCAGKGDWKLVDMCLTYGPSPSERSIVSTLLELLSLSETLRCISGDTLSRKLLLCKLLSQPFSDVLMQGPLSVLPVSALKQLLLFLSDSVGVASLLAPPYDSTPVNYNMLLDWIVLLIDVHFTRITLDHQCRQSLLALQSKILAQVTCYNRLSCILSFEKVQSQWTVRNSDRWLYKVETIQL